MDALCLIALSTGVGCVRVKQYSSNNKLGYHSGLEASSRELSGLVFFKGQDTCVLLQHWANLNNMRRISPHLTKPGTYKL